MQKSNSLLTGVILLVFLLGAAAWALAMLGENASGGNVGGGGRSTGGEYTITGSIPLTGAGLATGGDYKLTGGNVGTIFTEEDSAVAAPSFDPGSYSTALFESPQHVTVDFPGGAAGASGKLYYRQGGKETYSSGALLKDDDSLWYNIPASQFTIRGLEYYIELQTENGTTYFGSAAEPHAFRVQIDNEDVKKSTPAESYRMVGLPFGPTSSSVTSIFADDFGTYDRKKWRLGRWDPGTESYDEYPSVSLVAPGRAYWLITRTSQSFGANGQSIRPDRRHPDDVTGDYYVSVALEEGWNQFANPCPFTVDWSKVLFDDNGTVVGHESGVVEDFAHRYDGSDYEPNSALTISTWEGVFIRATKSGVTALVPFHESGASSSRSRGDKFAAMQSGADWEVILSLAAEYHFDRRNVAGVATGASSNYDAFDISEPPMAPEGVSLAFRLPNSPSHLCRSDIRSSLVAGHVWEIVISQAHDRKLTISGIEDIPADNEAQLVLDNGETMSLLTDQEILLPDEILSARLLIGPKSYVEEEVDAILPDEYSLEQNYPNPFNAATEIGFDLPIAEQVILEVYNLHGQRVATLVDKRTGAGYHKVTWDASGFASGVYLYRIQAGGFTDSRKMVLMK